MAVASQSWFQNWQPPTGLFTQNQPYHNAVSLQYQNNQPQKNVVPESSPNVLGLVPYLVAMGMMTVGPQYNLDSVQYPPVKPKVLETTGPLKTHYIWKQVDFVFQSPIERENLIVTGDYIPKNNLPLGIEIDRNRLFVSFPKWKDGIPCTLATIPKITNELSPLFRPYPNWDWHNTESCDGLKSVYRMQIDSCNRLWVLDSGQINVSVKPAQICAPKIVVFDLSTDRLILRYEIPDAYIKQDGLFSNIAVDIQKNRCEDAYAYAADVWRYGLVVFSLKERRSWRLTDHLFYPEPFAAAYNLHGLNFEWTDGIFSLALSPDLPEKTDRLLYYHPMSSGREFYVKTSAIKNETLFNEIKRQIRVAGESRGKDGQASSSVIDRNGIMFYNLVTRDSVGCWDMRKPYKRKNLGVLAKSNISLIFPNDLKLDKEKKQSLWVISNRLPFFLYSELDKSDYNFRIMSTFVDEAIEGTICDPNVRSRDEYDYDSNDIDYC